MSAAAEMAAMRIPRGTMRFKQFGCYGPVGWDNDSILNLQAHDKFPSATVVGSGSSEIGNDDSTARLSLIPSRCIL